MTDLDRFKELWDDLNPTLKAYKEEAKELRDSPGVIESTDRIEELQERLRESRRAQDRLETVLADVRSVRSRVKGLVKQLEEDYEDSWREAMQNTRIGEYMSAKEKDATYAASSIDELIKVRQAKKMLLDVEEIFEYVNTRFWGLNGVREDLNALIRAVSVEGQLER